MERVEILSEIEALRERRWIITNQIVEMQVRENETDDIVPQTRWDEFEAEMVRMNNEIRRLQQLLEES